jgi:hypothetical protein
MRDHDERREHGWQDYPRQGSGSQSDEAYETYGSSDEGRSWEPPYGDERTYGRQGQRGGSRFGSHETGPGAGRYARGGGSYGQGDYSRSAQRSPSREGYRYDDSGQAGHGGDEAREQGAGGHGGYSGYGSSGQGQFGPGGFARGGYGGSGYGGDYGQDVYGGGEYLRQSGLGADRSAPRSHDDTTGQGPVRDYGAYAGGGGDADDRSGAHQRADFDPDYLAWRRSQLDAYDRDYQHWREQQARRHDEDYHSWRDQRRRQFHEDFHGWRQSRTTDGFGGEAISPSTAGVSYAGASSVGGGATSGFATHELSGATNADLSGRTSRGATPGQTGSVGAGAQPAKPSDDQTSAAPPSPEAARAARAVDPAMHNIAEGGEGRPDLGRDDKKGPHPS